MLLWYWVCDLVVILGVLVVGGSDSGSDCCGCVSGGVGFVMGGGWCFFFSGSGWCFLF